LELVLELVELEVEVEVELELERNLVGDPLVRDERQRIQ